MPSTLLGSALLAASLALAQPVPPATNQPSPVASPPSAPTATPGTPAATPSSTPPTPTPTPVYAFVYRASPQPIPPSDVPVIAEIDVNASAITPPGPLHVRVLTSVAVVSVYAQTSLAFVTRGITIPKAQPGLFLFDGYIPDVPAFVRNHTFNVQFIATAANGQSTNVTLPLRLN